MTHLHKRSNQTFEIGSYISPDDNRTYDITIISYWKDAEQEKCGSPVEIVGYYFGGYDAETTDMYIDKWLANRNSEIFVLQTANKYLDGYLTVNREFLNKDTISQLEEAVYECGILLYDRDWKFEFKPPRMTRSAYLQQIENLYAEDKIDDDAFDALFQMADNYPDE